MGKEPGASTNPHLRQRISGSVFLFRFPPPKTKSTTHTPMNLQASGLKDKGWFRRQCDAIDLRVNQPAHRVSHLVVALPESAPPEPQMIINTNEIIYH